MLKTIRKPLWFISAFSKKYKHLIIIGIIISIIFGIILNKLQTYLPNKINRDIHLGLIGQYSTTNLPPEITKFINSGLTTIGDKQIIVPNLATNKTIDETGKIYTYKIKENLTWSNGQPINAEDINLTIPKVKIETSNQKTIKFTLPAKFAPFPSILTFPITNKAGLLPSPYKIKLKQKASGTLTQITINTGQSQTIINIYPTTNQAITAYKLGQIDAIIGLLQTNSSPDLSNFGITHKYFNPQKIIILILNHKDPDLNNKSTRQAIAYSLNFDRQQFKTALTTINPQSWVYNPLVKIYPPNPNKVKKLIGDKTLNLELATTPELLPMAEEIKNSINTDQIKIQIKVVTNPPENFQLLLTTFNIPPDPDQYPFWHSTQSGNIGRVTSDKLDKLLEDGRTTLNQNQRKEIYHEFQRTFAEELPAITLFHPYFIDLARNQHYYNIVMDKWRNW